MGVLLCRKNEGVDTAALSVQFCRKPGWSGVLSVGLCPVCPAACSLWQSRRGAQMVVLGIRIILGLVISAVAASLAHPACANECSRCPVPHLSLLFHSPAAEAAGRVSCLRQTHRVFVDVGRGAASVETPIFSDRQISQKRRRTAIPRLTRKILASFMGGGISPWKAAACQGSTE